jgi:flagellar hook-basal body complex protein FliE
MIEAISAVSGGLGSLFEAQTNGVGGSAIGGTSGTSTTSAASTVSDIGGIDFSNALSGVEASLNEADLLARQLATGQLTDVHQYMAAATKANLAVQLTASVRDQAVQAFQEVMRMQL